MHIKPCTVCLKKDKLACTEHLSTESGVTEIITTELFTGDEKNTDDNNNNCDDNNRLFLGICNSKGNFFFAIVESKRLPSVVTINEKLFL